MTIEEMKAKKIELGYSNEMIAELSGLPLSTVQKIFGGITKAPRKLTVDALTKVLSKDPSRKPDSPDKDSASPAAAPRAAGGNRTVYAERSPGRGSFREPAGAYIAARKRYTIDDYYALPDDQRVELIDGVFYDMAAPAVIHQLILQKLYLLFAECVSEHGADCEVFLAPCDVRLDMDMYTMLQPDLFILCHGYDIRAKRIEGAPDLVIEILSPSTRSKDMILKLYKYKRAGVREYWVVDPENRTVTVHNLEAKEESYDPVRYDFSARIPVGISEGRCSIDFSRILKKIQRYYD